MGEVGENLYLLYSFTDHSFATWNGVTGQFKRCNLISKGSNKVRQGDVDLETRFEPSGGQPLAKDCILNDRSVHYKWLSLHPGCYDNSFPYIISVSRDDKVQLRKFQIVEGYSCPIMIDEEKPGIRAFDTIWQKDGTLVTFQVKRVRDTSGAKSLQVRASREINGKRKGAPVKARPNYDEMEMLGSDMEDFELDDSSSAAVQGQVRYAL